VDARQTAVLALALALGALSPARADQVPGKGGRCAATFDTGTAVTAPGANSAKPYSLVCADGDPLCDADGAADGVCSIVIGACVGQITPTCLPEWT
jgi:hypothetical protein